jgi:hypothetical protein
MILPVWVVVLLVVFGALLAHAARNHKDRALEFEKLRLADELRRQLNDAQPGAPAAHRQQDNVCRHCKRTPL